ncbi:MAG: hypothetical protein HQ541_17560 [Mariniphaga sp.]|nr:hypothetical protein [Mariniphaga sp.]
MYFLNGSRIYIKPESGCNSSETQLRSCINKLGEINSGKRIYKINFFVDANSEEDYIKLSKLAEEIVSIQISEKIILNFISQAPLACKVIAEAFYYDPSIWNAKFIFHPGGNAVLFQNNSSRFLVGNVQSIKSSMCLNQSEEAFLVLKEIFELNDFKIGSIIRQWNYIEDILGVEKGKQNYQEFNNVRSRFYGTAFSKSGYPSATGIGMNRGGVIIEFIALDSKKVVSKPIENPNQIAAHNYSKQVLIGDENISKTTPKFERARYLDLLGRKAIFISGTASVVGENTIGIDNPAEQTKVTIQNIQQLYSNGVLENISGKLEPKYGHARVYVKSRKDYKIIRRMFRLYYGDLPVVYILADICRTDLLVEIEGEVILE